MINVSASDFKGGQYLEEGLSSLGQGIGSALQHWQTMKDEQTKQDQMMEDLQPNITDTIGVTRTPYPQPIARPSAVPTGPTAPGGAMRNTAYPQMTGKTWVRTPDGRTGTIPNDSLPAALKAGYTSL